MISFDGSSLMCSWCLEGYVLNIEGGCSEKKSCPRGKYPNYANNGEC